MAYLKRLFLYVGPPLLWMAFIFFLSSQHKVALGPTFAVDFVIKKGLHMFEYAFLYFLFFRMGYGLTKKSFPKMKLFLFAFLITIAFSLSDEFHQTFVPSREGTARDIFIDTAGVVLMYIGLRSTMHFRIWKKIL